MQDRPSTQVKLSPADKFRPIIEAAIAAGADLSDQVLQLTPRRQRPAQARSEGPR